MRRKPIDSATLAQGMHWGRLLSGLSAARFSLGIARNALHLAPTLKADLLDAEAALEGLEQRAWDAYERARRE